MKQNPTMSMNQIMAQMVPAGGANPAAAAGLAPNAAGLAPNPAMAMNAAMMNPQATKTARELYIGGLVPGCTAAQLQEFMSSSMTQMNLTTAPGP